jgi:hypothetical protein
MQQPPRILLACFPKSGSTFLGKALSDYLDVHKKAIHSSPEIQTISPEQLAKFAESGFCSQSHLLPTKSATKLLNDFDVQVVVLERNLLDCIVSLADFYFERVGSDEGVWKDSFVGQTGFYDKNFLSLSQKERCGYLIETCVNWYLEFHIAWRKKSACLSRPPVFIYYEEFFPNVEAGFSDLLKKIGSFDQKRLENFQFPLKEPGSQGVRFNKGKSGRGVEVLTESQQKRVADIIKIYESATKESISKFLL